MHHDPTFAAMEAAHRVRTLIAEAERSRLLATIRKERKRAKAAGAGCTTGGGPVPRPATA